jgi:hypothetical protein
MVSLFRCFSKRSEANEDMNSEELLEALDPEGVATRRTCGTSSSITET